VLLLVAHTTVTIQHVLLTLAAAVVVNAKLAGRQIAKALASQTMCTQRGSAMATATMAHTFLLITVVPNVLQV